ncbi:MAG: prepilin-type N-terminal cleavage/methylation domain-containing protein [Acidobacteriota bacterium]|nr:prepilin-type N-terminal cleavage/methylation domain-containing protein [Acidobacteriota bacterium]
MWVRRTSKSRSGFSLIELLIVVAIIGIIAAIAIPNLLSAIQRARQKRTMGDMKALGNAIESAFTDCSAYPPTDGDLGAPDCKTPAGISIGLQKGGWWFQNPVVCDGWRWPLHYVGLGVQGGGSVDIGDDNCLQIWTNPWATHYSLRSLGRDHQADCTHAKWNAALNAYEPEGTCTLTCAGFTEVRCDIVFAGGQFIAFPEGMQR